MGRRPFAASLVRAEHAAHGPRRNRLRVDPVLAVEGVILRRASIAGSARLDAGATVRSPRQSLGPGRESRRSQTSRMQAGRCALRGRAPLVSVVQPAQAREGDEMGLSVEPQVQGSPRGRRLSEAQLRRRGSRRRSPAAAVGDGAHRARQHGRSEPTSGAAASSCPAGPSPPTGNPSPRRGSPCSRQR